MRTLIEKLILPRVSRLLRRGGLQIILVAIIGLGFVPAPSTATAITTCPSGICTLLDLFNGDTITINDKRFDSWRLFNQATSLAQFPDYALISVNPIDDLLNPGLRFSMGSQASIANGSADDFVYFQFGYRVQTVDNAPRIGGDHLRLGDYNFSAVGGEVGIFQTICQGGFLCPLASPDLVSLANVFVDNTISAANNFDFASFAPHAELFVDSQVAVFNTVEGESVALDGFEQGFFQIPEPASFALLGIGLAGLFRMRRGIW